MKLTKQSQLFFQEGTSDKVYEVDLCEVGADQYVVNFRYGRRGATLKDGSKTPLPVKRAEAQRVFDALVKSKVDKGYAPHASRGDAQHATGMPYRTAPSHAGANDARATFVLETLSGSSGKWSRERAIWRAGELRLTAAESVLLRLLAAARVNTDRKKAALQCYAIAWALGRLGSTVSVQPLAALAAEPTLGRHVQRMATEAWRALAPASELTAMQVEQSKALPQALQTALQNEDAPAMHAAFSAHLLDNPVQAAGTLQLLYLLDAPVARFALLAALRTLPLVAPFFYSLRYLFKAAEFRRDAEVFAILAYRFETVRANKVPGYYEKDKLKVYTAATREYMRRRSWRSLRRMGHLGDSDYVKMAVGALLPFSDTDAKPVRHGYRCHWDAFAPYRAFNGVLYTQSPRYELVASTKAWRTRATYVPGSAAPAAREEAFPALWEAAPAGLMHLLAESACAPVHEFAAKALRACTAFTAALEDDDLAILATSPYLVTATLGYDLTKQAIDRGRLASASLLLALASSTHEPARAFAIAQIEARRTALLQDTVFLAALVLAKHADARTFARRLLRSASLPQQIGAALVGRIVASLLNLGTGAEAIARDATQTLTQSLGEFLATAPPTVIRDLLAHPLEGVQELGAELLLKHDSRSGLLPVETILSVFRSEFASVRSVGLRLLSEMSEDALALNFKVLVVLSTDKNSDLRHGVRPLLGRVYRAHHDIGAHLANGLLDALLRRKISEEAESHVLAVLRDDLREVANTWHVDEVWRLLQSGSQRAQELGGILLSRQDGSALGLEQIVRLGSHEILSVREASWAMLDKNLTRVTEDMPTAVRITDATWADSRAWARTFLRKLPAQHFTVECLVAIVDSTREDVQAFGRELVQTHFRERDGATLLLRLSEHPGRNVQLFATNYLERFAGGAPERLHELIPFFTSVLSRVNSGRLAKKRVFAFLEKEAVHSEAQAVAVLNLLERVSASCSIETRARAIEIMCAIHARLPHLPSPLRFVPPTRPRTAQAVR
jgi:predicted DNA-binding WGR domain protein